MAPSLVLCILSSRICTCIHELHWYVSLPNAVSIYLIPIVIEASFSLTASPWRSLSFLPRFRIWRGVHWSCVGSCEIFLKRAGRLAPPPHARPAPRRARLERWSNVERQRISLLNPLRLRCGSGGRGGGGAGGPLPFFDFTVAQRFWR